MKTIAQYQIVKIFEGREIILVTRVFAQEADGSFRVQSYISRVDGLSVIDHVKGTDEITAQQNFNLWLIRDLAGSKENKTFIRGV